MKISYNWIKELVPELSLAPVELAELLTMHSFETEVVGTIAIDPNVTVAKVIKLEPHPNADRLQLATVDTGSEHITVICGAPNISEGAVIPFSPPGTKLIDEDGQEFTLQPATIRDVESPGMLNSPRELGLGDEHSGLYLLPTDTPIGSKLIEHLPTDTVLDADVTPNRGHDCLSHRGIAREVAALLKLEVVELKIPDQQVAELSGWQLAIEDNTDTPAYFGSLLTNVTIKPAPLWLQARLWTIGARPINNVVDITNYVMFELGNPTHTFDTAKLPGRPSGRASRAAGKTIGVRRATAGEQITTLDDSTHVLTPDTLLITSDNKPIALAGIMGGQSSEVNDSTTSVFLEVANFRAYIIQQASASLKKITEGSVRWSKGVPASLAAEASNRAIQLLQEHAEATLSGTIKQLPAKLAPYIIDFRPARVSRIAGVEIDAKQAREVLTRLRCEVAAAGEVWRVTVPYDRGDLQGEHDLVEEVIRVIGLDAIPTKEPANVEPVTLLKKIQVREFLRDELAKAGLTETYNYSFDNESYTQALNLDTSSALELTNPTAPEQRYLRTSLLPRLLENLVTNKGEVRQKRVSGSRNLFEISQVWSQGDDKSTIPGVTEREYLAAVITDELDAQQLISDLLEKLGVGTDPNDDLWHTGAIDEATANVLKLPTTIQIIELNLDSLVPLVNDEFSYQLKLSDEVVQYEAGSSYPPVQRDLSLRISANTTIEQVQEVIERIGGELVTDVDLFDVYDPAQDTSATTADTSKSFAFHLTYQAPDRTLSNEEVSELHNRIITTLKKELKIELRS